MKKTVIFSTFLILFLAAASAHSGKLYRWKDDQGNWILSDKVPPEHAKQQRSELNQGGRTIKIFEAAKTPEQLALEAELKRLNKDKERILQEQQQADTVLLKTFQREQDIQNALQAKLNTLGTRNQLAVDQSSNQRKQLQSLQKKAAEYERNGRTIPAKLLGDIHTTEKIINDYESQLDNIESKKKVLTKQASLDSKRLRALKLGGSKGLSINQAGVPALGLGKIRCSADACDDVWSSALHYARQFANTRQLMVSDTLFMTNPANNNDDMSISLTRVDDDQGAIVYLDIRCKDSEAGRALCKSNSTLSIVQQFGAKVAANLAVD